MINSSGNPGEHQCGAGAVILERDMLDDWDYTWWRFRFGSRMDYFLNDHVEFQVILGSSDLTQGEYRNVNPGITMFYTSSGLYDKRNSTHRRGSRNRTIFMLNLLDGIRSLCC